MAAETQTGGRSATSAVIGGGRAIAVGKPDSPTVPGFEWIALTDVARLETGHTPSRRHPEYWDGDIPWIGIKDATRNHGRVIYSTLQTVTQDGINNSSARVLPEGTVCLSRTASVGYVVVMGVPMATSQDFVDWICGPKIDGRYLKFILQSERDALLRFASGTTHQTIYFPEVKAFHALLPAIEEQHAIAATLGALDAKIESNRRAIDLILRLGDALFEEACLVGSSRVHLGDVATFHNRRRVPLSSPEREARPGPYPYYGATGIFGYVDDYLFDEVLVLVGEDGSVVRQDGTPFVQYIWGKAWINNHAHPLTGNGISNELLLMLLSRADVRPLVTGAVQPKISMGNLKSLELELPDDKSRVKLESHLADLFAVHRVRSDEIRELIRLRDALLPELLSGRIRVPEAEKAVDEVAS